MLKITNLNFKYNKNPVLKGVSFGLEKGIKALVAPNGAGKTTLLNCISQQLKADGSIIIDDKEINNRKILENLTFLGDSSILDPEIAAIDYMKYVAKTYNINYEKIDKVANLTEISHFYKNKIGTYSLGMKNRTMIALSILPDTEYILLDEPLSGLDPSSVKKMKELLLNLSKTKGILLSSHILDDINDLTDDILFLKDGKIIEFKSYSSQLLKIESSDDSKSFDILNKNHFLHSKDKLIIDQKDLNGVLKILFVNDIEIINIQNLKDSLKEIYFEIFT
ncbi:ABC transporter ATP-binding protein [Lagierella sp.]|uniref:ABC transporter ATP-binding protein n=1 Tax=Lagierella sp. TaxID=2849657 RepID=UPI00260FFD84|nr:ABC transporter ATP-binding protein [Lagierella sp.]